VATSSRITAPDRNHGGVLPKNALLLVALLIGLAACSGGERPSTNGATTSTVAADPDRDVPAELQGFLERAERGAVQPFTAEYAVLRKLGSTSSTVLVEQDPPELRITVGGVVVDPTSEEQLAPYGIFSGFATTGPVEAIRSLARRDDASAPQFSERTVAGVTLECVAVPVQQAVTATWCITPDGVFGYVDNPAVRYELTRYEPATS
jgi:hypothetical protein